jgi:hypothetical protein
LLRRRDLQIAVLMGSYALLCLLTLLLGYGGLALLAVLPFYPPGKISFGGGEQHMPVWLVREIARLDPSAKLGQPGGQPSPEATAVSGETPAR